MSDAPPPPPNPEQPQPESAKDAKARAKGEKAYAKASRPWYKKKRFILPLGLLLLIIIVAALGSGDDDGSDTPAASDQEAAEGADDGAAEAEGEDAEEALFPDRVDRQPNDIEAQVGEPISVGGYSATITSLEHTDAINDFEDEGYLVAEVELSNDSDQAQSYNTFDWRVQTPNGQVLDAAFVGEEQLGSGDLVQGGNVTGQVYWEVGHDISGEYYVIYKPDAFDAARAIWGKEF